MVHMEDRDIEFKQRNKLLEDSISKDAQSKDSNVLEQLNERII